MRRAHRADRLGAGDEPQRRRTGVVRAAATPRRLARREQLVADLPAAFDLLKQKYSGNYPSMISFITGPSRTGDIERILVLGAHGPKQLTIFLI